MGIDIATELAHQNHQTAEQRLWRHVLIHAFEEAKLPTSDRKSSIYKIHHNPKTNAKIFKFKLVKSSKDTNVKL